MGEFHREFFGSKLATHWLHANHRQISQWNAYRRFTGASPIYWLISMVTVDKHYRIRCTHYTPELSVTALFGRRRVTHEPPKRVSLGAGCLLAAEYPK